MKSPLTEEQRAPEPERADQPSVWDLVIADMHDRDRVGRARYGTPLQPHNGRDAQVDAYQEALDLVVYMRQAIEERRSPMSRGQRNVHEFRAACGLYNGDFGNPGFADPAQADLAVSLVVEEALELAEAATGCSMARVRDVFAEALANQQRGARDIVDAADGIADVLVTAYGAACVLGIHARPVFDEVHRTNMAKVGGPRRADGKLLKPPGWKPPDVAAVLERQRSGQ